MPILQTRKTGCRKVNLPTVVWLSPNHTLLPHSWWSVTGLWYSQEDWPSVPKAALTLQWQGLRGLEDVVVPASHVSPAASFLASLDCCAAAMVQSWAHPFCWIPLLPASPRIPICKAYSLPHFALTSLQGGFLGYLNDDFRPSSHHLYHTCIPLLLPFYWYKSSYRIYNRPRVYI